MKISHLIMLSVIAGLVIGILHKNSVITNLNEEIRYNSIRIESLKEDNQVSLRLLKNPNWYVVHENKLSSLPNGRGEVVDLSDRSLLPMGNRLGIRRPFPNTKIHFSPAEYSGQIYTVAGGWLTYEYLDD